MKTFKLNDCLEDDRNELINLSIRMFDIAEKLSPTECFDLELPCHTIDGSDLVRVFKVTLGVGTTDTVSEIKLEQAA